MKKVVLIIAGCCALIAVLLVLGLAALVFVARSKETIVWDLSHGDTLEAVNWPKSLSGDEFEHKGNIDLTIIDRPITAEVYHFNGPPPPRGAPTVIFHEDVQEFFCWRKGDKLDGAAIFFGGYYLSGEQAYTKAKAIMTTWCFRPENMADLEKWHNGIAARIPSGQFMRQYEHDRHFDSDIYPAFDTIKAGNVRLRISVFGGDPGEGNCRCGLTLTF